MDKILTIAIPCYNSQDYMDTAILSALGDPNETEVLIVDDGSHDDTAKIGRLYEEKYPDTVRYIHKENGGHGDAVMCGLSNASGRYFKVVDSDDRLDPDSLHKIITILKEYCREDDMLDMFISNYVYDKEGEERKVSIHYKKILPQDTVFTWNEADHFKTGHNLLMHSVIYRTKLLKDCGLTLPKHTFYVDNIFVYYPLPYVEKMYYLDTDLYFYKIGRQDQSVNEKVMIGRIDQQLYVNHLMIEMYDLSKIENERLREYMAQYLTMILTVSSALLVKEGSDESLSKKEALWQSLHDKSEGMYEVIRRQPLTKFVEKGSTPRNKVLEVGYGLAQKIYHFN